MSFLEGIFYMIWRGFAIGVIISAPMGPVGILCVQRTLEKGRRTGFFTGVGAAISDLIYCLLTGFGLSLIEDFLKANENVIQLIGSVVLVAFGVYLFKSTPARKLKKPDEVAQTSRRKDVLQGFLFTFSNPLIIFLIIGLFARFNFSVPEISFIQCVFGYVSIIFGALCWWWIVSFFVDKVRKHFNLRSMWLINKIIGSIIMIFAVVGIFTAISGLANASTTSPASTNSLSKAGEGYYNSARGMGPFASDSTARMLSLDGGDFTFSFRASTPRNAYPWQLLVAGKEGSITFNVNVKGEPRDCHYFPELEVTACRDGECIGSASLHEGFDMETGWNSFRLVRSGDSYALLGGNRSLSPVLAVEISGFRPDSVGFPADSKGLRLDYLSCLEADSQLPDTKEDLSHFGNPDVRESYFARTRDEIEGVYSIFDRTFDESQLRPGGNYSLALVKEKGGYKMIYIDGATKNASRWHPGALKGRLKETGHRNVFDVEWYDPSGFLLQGEAKAQFKSPDLISVQFVDHSSTMRLRKLR